MDGIQLYILRKGYLTYFHRLTLGKQNVFNNSPAFFNMSDPSNYRAAFSVFNKNFDWRL